MANHVNICLLRGTVEKIQNDLLTMICRPPNPREPGNFYTNVIPMDVGHLPKTKLKGLVGKRIECSGQIINLDTADDEPNQSTFRPFKDHFGITEDPEDCNLAEVVGDTPGGVIFRPRKGASRAFSNVLMLAGGTYVWAVAFRHYAQKLKEDCPRGSLLSIGGRLNWREYEDQEDGWREVYEVVADGEQIKVLKKAKVVDHLADIRAKGMVEVEEPVDPAGGEPADGVV